MALAVPVKVPVAEIIHHFETLDIAMTSTGSPTSRKIQSGKSSVDSINPGTAMPLTHPSDSVYPTSDISSVSIPNLSPSSSCTSLALPVTPGYDEQNEFPGMGSLTPSRLSHSEDSTATPKAKVQAQNPIQVVESRADERKPSVASTISPARESSKDNLPPAAPEILRNKLPAPAPAPTTTTTPDPAPFLAIDAIASLPSCPPLKQALSTPNLPTHALSTSPVGSPSFLAFDPFASHRGRQTQQERPTTSSSQKTCKSEAKSIKSIKAGVSRLKRMPSVIADGWKKYYFAPPP